MKHYFSKFEWLLWSLSCFLIFVFFLLFDRNNYLTLTASLIGVTSLILNAKGNPVGQALMVVFSLLYGWISWRFAYYGEMITYVGMTGPMALAALCSWLRNPYNGKRSQVAVGKLQPFEYWLMPLLTVLVTGLFYFILKYFDTANLFPSTLSVTTSFIAVYLTFRRSPYFALAYASNDVVLIWLWILAAAQNRAYICVILCFVVFLVNDLYGFFCWQNMRRQQAHT